MFRCAVAGVTIMATCLVTPTTEALAASSRRPEAVALGVGTSSVQAEAIARDLGISGPVVEALTRDLGISEAQVVTRLVAERHAAALEPELAASLGDSYGGSWLTEDASALVVATTDPARTSSISARGARPVLVSRSLTDLQDVVRRLDRAARRTPPGPALWYADVRTNQVILQVPDARTAQALALAVPGVTVTVSSELPRTYADIIGGDPFFIGSMRCTIGFSATKGTTPGFVTAGHCGRTGDTVTYPSGTVQGSSFPGNDYAWVATPGHTPQPYVRGPGGTLVPVHGSNPAPIGSSVCRSGPTTGWHCGTVQQLNATITYAQGTVYGMTRTNVCAEPGDSGGPFISGGQAQGVTSGGSGNCSTGGTTYFQPINEILYAYGLTLRTA